MKQVLSKEKVIKVIAKISIILITILLIWIVYKTNVFLIVRNTTNAIKQEEVETKTQCEIVKVNTQNIETLIKIENINGIERVTTEDITIQCKGKSSVALDRVLNNGKVYPISVKIVGKETEEQFTIVAEREPTISIVNIDTTGDGSTKTVKIQYNNNDEDNMHCYSLDGGATWNEYIDQLDILEEETRTITAESKVKQEKIKGKLVRVQPKECLSLIISTSLIQAIEKGIIKNDTYYTIAIKDEQYLVHTYVENEDLILKQNKVYGNANDVGTASNNASSMVIIKVNGNMTINSGVTLTTYGTKYGGPKGMLLYVAGDLQNNGTITMTARGAKAPGQNVYLWKNEDSSKAGQYEFVPKVGGTGATAIQVEDSKGNNGANGTNRKTGRRWFRRN